MLNIYLPDKLSACLFITALFFTSCNIDLNYHDVDFEQNIKRLDTHMKNGRLTEALTMTSKFFHQYAEGTPQIELVLLKIDTIYELTARMLLDRAIEYYEKGDYENSKLRIKDILRGYSSTAAAKEAREFLEHFAKEISRTKDDGPVFIKDDQNRVDLSTNKTRYL